MAQEIERLRDCVLEGSLEAESRLRAAQRIFEKASRPFTAKDGPRFMREFFEAVGDPVLIGTVLPLGDGRYGLRDRKVDVSQLFGPLGPEDEGCRIYRHGDEYKIETHEGRNLRLGRLNENSGPGHEKEYLWWFWYQPSTGRLEHVDGNHTSAAYYDLGIQPRELRPDEKENGIDLADDEIIAAAIAEGWVRGRYGYQDHRQTWAWAEEHDPNAELSLQGAPRDVWKTAVELAKKWPFGTLYVDFGASHDSMDSVKLTGDRLEFYLKRGKVPSQMRME